MLASTLACQDRSKPATPPAVATPPQGSAPAAAPDPTPTPTPTPTPVESGSASAVPVPRSDIAEASNAFGFALWKRLGEGNLAISPASISAALAMTWGGAKGGTADEMQAALHVKGDRAAVMTAWGKLATQLQSPSRKLELRIANRLFGDKSTPFEADYLARTKAAYGAPLEPMDFATGHEAARGKINKWVEDRTEHRIKELIPPTGITNQTRLVLVNAIYFLADWKEPFEPLRTNPSSFMVGGRSPNSVPMMHGRERFGYAKGDGVSILAMPYAGEDASMLVVLPEKVDGLPALERTLDDRVLASWSDSITVQEVEVALPRFTIDPPDSLELRKQLEALGIRQAFDREAADFTGIANPPKRADRLSISAVFHKAFVKVDEKGTEAAAATAVSMARGGGPPPAAVQFVADHPFLFFIVDNKTGLILFMGRVTDPVSPTP